MKKFLSVVGATSSSSYPSPPWRDSRSTRTKLAILPEFQFSSWDLLARLDQCHPASSAQYPPHDVLHEIFILLLNSSGRRSLLSCALVCRSWNFSCCPMLLRSIRIPSLLCPHPELASAMVYHGRSRRRSVLRCFLDLISNSPRISTYLVQLELEGSLEFAVLRTVLDELRELRSLHLNPIMFESLDERPYTSPPTRRSLNTLVLSQPIAETPHTLTHPICIDVIPWFDAIEDLQINHCEDRFGAIVHLADNYIGAPVSVKKITVSGKSLQHVKPLAKSILSLQAIDSFEALRLDICTSQDFIRTVTESCPGTKSCSIDLLCNRSFYDTDHAFTIGTLRLYRYVPRL